MEGSLLAEIGGASGASGFVVALRRCVVWLEGNGVVNGEVQWTHSCAAKK